MLLVTRRAGVLGIGRDACMPPCVSAARARMGSDEKQASRDLPFKNESQTRSRGYAVLGSLSIVTRCRMGSAVLRYSSSNYGKRRLELTQLSCKHAFFKTCLGLGGWKEKWGALNGFRPGVESESATFLAIMGREGWS